MRRYRKLVGYFTVSPILREIAHRSRKSCMTMKGTSILHESHTEPSVLEDTGN